MRRDTWCRDHPGPQALSWRSPSDGSSGTDRREPDQVLRTGGACRRPPIHTDGAASAGRRRRRRQINRCACRRTAVARPDVGSEALRGSDAGTGVTVLEPRGQITTTFAILRLRRLDSHVSLIFVILNAIMVVRGGYSRIDWESH